MLSIVISACLISDPGTCKEHVLPMALDIDPTHCAMYAPPHFGRWSEDNPGWRIVRWRCGSASNGSRL